MDLNIFILFHKIEAFTKQAIFLISDLLMARQPCDKAASLFYVGFVRILIVDFFSIIFLELPLINLNSYSKNL